MGVEKDASDKAIKSSYRSLAKKHHPDIHPGDKEAEDKFKKISAAYELLSNPKTRAAYDQGEINENFQSPNQKQQYYRDYAGKQGSNRYQNISQEQLDEMLRNMVGGRDEFGGFEGFQNTNRDAHYSIDIDFMECVLGAKKTIQIPGGKTLDIHIPKGIKDGQKLKLKGQGASEQKSFPPGDAYIQIHIRPHSFFKREGNDIYIDVPVSIDEWVLGKKIKVPTIHGPVEVKLPKGLHFERSLRLKGKGILQGDQHINLKLELPEKVDSELETVIQKWAETHSYNPRKSLERIL